MRKCLPLIFPFRMVEFVKAPEAFIQIQQDTPVQHVVTLDFRVEQAALIAPLFT